MNEKRSQPKHQKFPSLNEPVRKRFVDHINSENNLMMQRLQRVGSVISNSKLERDFQHHLKAEQNLRRRQMKPLTLPRDLHANSPLRSRNSDADGSTRLFDANLYTTQRGQFLQGSSLDSLSDAGGVKSVADFRREVIAAKKLYSGSDRLTNSSNAGVEHSFSSQREGQLHTSDHDVILELSHRAEG